MINKNHEGFDGKTFPYEFCIASNTEAEILNDKMDAFIVRQISYLKWTPWFRPKLRQNS